MYQLVAMESESSFWWDSVDSTVNLNEDHDNGEQKFVETDDGMLRVVMCNVALFLHKPALQNSSAALPNFMVNYTPLTSHSFYIQTALAQTLRTCTI